MKVDANDDKIEVQTLKLIKLSLFSSAYQVVISDMTLKVSLSNTVFWFLIVQAVPRILISPMICLDS